VVALGKNTVSVPALLARKSRRGLIAAPFLARLLPFGLDGRIAATIMGADRWNAGAALMAAQARRPGATSSPLRRCCYQTKRPWEPAGKRPPTALHHRHAAALTRCDAADVNPRSNSIRGFAGVT
jgi:Family of unknown function (DUF6118)